MEDKYNAISYLDKFMPKTTVQINEESKHITDAEAPSVKGYFKLISLRYMKRVKDIKKLCVDYVNTYIDGALNVAEKMDDVKLAENRDSLAKDIKFELEGFSTGGGSKGAQTKAGVAFLVGDKALKDKLNAILGQIDLRASKSPILKNWADLMVLQSKVLATNKLYKLTNEMIDEEKYKSSKKDTDSVLNDINDLIKDVENNQTDYQKMITKMIEHFGERDVWFGGKKDVTIEDVKKYVPNHIKKGDEGNEIDSARNEFYKDITPKDLDGGKKAIQEILDKQTDKDLSDDDKEYIKSCVAVNNTKANGSFFASPIDVAIAMANTESAQKHITAKKEDYQNFLKKYKIDVDDKTKGVIKDKDFDMNLAYVYNTMFAESVDTRLHIKTPTEFINEQLFNTYMELKDMELTMMDILDDCDGGCMYIGNFPSIKEDDVDYVMLDGNGSFGFYKENGNLDLALEYGQPQDISLVEFSDGQRKAVLSTILDYISDDVLGKLG